MALGYKNSKYIFSQYINYHSSLCFTCDIKNRLADFIIKISFISIVVQFVTNLNNKELTFKFA